MTNSISPLSIFALMSTFAMVGACNAESATSGAVVEKLSPAPGQTNVATDTVIRVELQSPPSRHHLEKTISLFDGQGRPVPGTTQAEPFALLFVPAAPLADNEDYQVCIVGLETQGGLPVSGYRFDPELDQVEAFDGSFCYHFSTKAILNVIRSVFDPDTSTLRIYFSDAIATDSLSAVSVSDSNSKHLDTRIRYSPALFRLTLILDRQRPVQRPIVVTLPATVRSRDGHALSNGEDDDIVFESPDPAIADE